MHPCRSYTLREDYWFVFYSERMDKMWMMSSVELIAESVQNTTGKNAGKRSIWSNGKRTDKATGKMIEVCKPQFEKHLATDFSRLKAASGQESAAAGSAA
jgi:hypothetical protein